MKHIKRKAAKGTEATKGTINASVAEIQDVDEGRLYSIGFKYFNDSICALKNVDAKISRKVHEVYRNMGRCSSIISLRNLPHDIKPIQNSGNYKEYYKNVTDDTEVHEFDAGRCRGFFFCDDTKKIIQMLAIDHHPEYKKNKK